jgi:hypothetical protein
MGLPFLINGWMDITIAVIAHACEGMPAKSHAKDVTTLDCNTIAPVKQNEYLQ